MLTRHRAWIFIAIAVLVVGLFLIAPVYRVRCPTGTEWRFESDFAIDVPAVCSTMPLRDFVSRKVRGKPVR
jgi:hypothetical protein